MIVNKPYRGMVMFEFIDVKFKNVLEVPKLFIEKGKITTIVGASGSGKTTFLKLLNKMISPTQGRILFMGTDLSQIDSIAHRRRVSLLSQNPVIFEGNIRDNLTIGLKFQGKPLPSDDLLIDILERVRLQKQLNSSADTLSGGEKQRLALGRVLLLNPDVYLLDEPCSALDEVTEELIIEMMADLVKKNGKTLVLVTHSKAIAKHYSDTIIEVIDGKCSGEVHL